LWYNVTLKCFNVCCCSIGWCLLSFTFMPVFFLTGHLLKKCKAFVRNSFSLNILDKLYF
jgi:hypothetical protein